MRKLLRIAVIVFVFLVSCKKEKENSKENMITFLESPTAVDTKQPYLFANGNQLLLSWTQKINDSTHILKYSEFDKKKWTKPVDISIGDNWFVNWADFPVIAKNQDKLLTHYLQKSDEATYAYDIHLMLSNTNGNTWNSDFLLHKDSTKTEHGFVSILPYKDSFFVTWLDGRNTGGTGHDEDHHNSGTMNIRAATVLSGGQVIDDALVDGKTCDCCQTSAAITSKGPIIVYRDRSDEEIRDIYISRLLDGNWTVPKLIHNDNWKINGCPVNGPKAASLNNTLVVAWFTAAEGNPKVNIAFSKDDGTNFDVPIQIDDGKPIGRVDVALLDEGHALVSWMESTKNEAEIKVVKVAQDGKINKSMVITSISASRATGFPQLEVVDDFVYVGYNHIANDQATIKIARTKVSVFD